MSTSARSAILIVLGVLLLVPAVLNLLWLFVALVGGQGDAVAHVVGVAIFGGLGLYALLTGIRVLRERTEN